jgi:adenylate kinase
VPVCRRASDAEQACRQQLVLARVVATTDLTAQLQPKIIIAGAPASGKGTQCEFIVEKFGVVHISTGDALRAQVAAGTELGKLAKECMDKGALVPDDVMIGIVKSRLAEDDCKERGWLLDGFPRTGQQAQAMADLGIAAEKFILLNVPDSVLIERCVGRRSDPVTGKIYHLTFNPPPDDAEVQKRLVHRSDDTEEAMVKRIEQYKKNVDAIKGFYKDITQEFDGVGDKMKLADDVATFIAK